MILSFNHSNRCKGCPSVFVYLQLSMAVCLYFIKRFLNHVDLNYCSKDLCVRRISLRSVMENQIPDSSKKRELDESTSSDAGNEAKRIKLEENKIPSSSNRIRKPKKVALLLSYLGKCYYGMQRNQGVDTVEAQLLRALLQAEIILPEEHETPQVMKFQRSARTDKGVSAVRQIVSLKVPLKEISDSFPDKVNNLLPPDIQVLCIKRVTQAFDAKIACDARTYSYVLPTFTFSDSNPVDELYRISDVKLKEINDFLNNYVGTHNFYNFTSGRLPGDASCKRFIMSCKCDEPFVDNDIEFITVRIKGQSFMLHQIRKMIGLTIAVIKKYVSADKIVERMWKCDRLDIPMAPSLGLMLEEVHYDWYNNKYGSDGIHQPLKWDQYEEDINKFREKIINSMVTSERNEQSMLHWLETLPCHTFDVRHSHQHQKIILEPKVIPLNETVEEEQTESQSFTVKTIVVEK